MIHTPSLSHELVSYPPLTNHLISRRQRQHCIPIPGHLPCCGCGRMGASSDGMNEYPIPPALLPKMAWHIQNSNVYRSKKAGINFILKTRGFASFQFWFEIDNHPRTTQPRGLIIIRGAAASHLASVSSTFSFKAQLSSALLLLFMRAMDECKIEVNDDPVMQQRGHSPEDSFSAKMVRRTPMILEQAGHRCSCLSLESNAPRTCCIKPRVACVHGCQTGTLG